jgi:hypothetical protein
MSALYQNHVSFCGALVNDGDIYKLSNTVFQQILMLIDRMDSSKVPALEHSVAFLPEEQVPFPRKLVFCMCESFEFWWTWPSQHQQKCHHRARSRLLCSLFRHQAGPPTRGRFSRNFQICNLPIQAETPTNGRGPFSMPKNSPEKGKSNDEGVRTSRSLVNQNPKIE